jgi:hypothetical protein
MLFRDFFYPSLVAACAVFAAALAVALIWEAIDLFIYI